MLLSVLSAQEAVIRADDPFLPRENDDAIRIEKDKIAQVAIPMEFRHIEGVGIQIKAKNKRRIIYSLINNSNNSISFGCTGINHPSTAIEVLNEGRWQPPKNFMICGTGLYLANLTPKKSILFEVEIRGSGTQMRVGIQIMGPKNAGRDRTLSTIWSPPVDTKG